MISIRRVVLTGALAGLALAAPATALAAPMAFRGNDDDGSRVVFTTTERMTTQDTDSAVDVYERSGGVTRLVSIGPVGGNANVAATYGGTAAFNISSRVAFTTTERLTADDLDNSQDVYVSEDGVTQRASKGTGLFPGNGAFPAVVNTVLENGIVIFQTDEKLHAGDTDPGARDLYLFDQSLGFVTGPSQQNGTGGSGNFDVSYEGKSPGGNDVFFSTDEELSTEEDTDNNASDIYVYRRFASDKLVSIEPGANDDDVDVDFGGATAGGLVAFETTGTFLGSDADTDVDVYTEDIDTDTPAHASDDFDDENVDFAGITPTDDKVYIETNDDAGAPATDPDNDQDVYEIDGTTPTKVSAGNGDFDADFAGSDDAGGHVAYTTAEDLTGIDNDSFPDLYEKEGVVQTDLISQRVNAGAEEPETPFFRGYSPNGERVLFSTDEKITAADTDANSDTYGRNAEGEAVKVTPGNASFTAAFAGSSEDRTAVFYTTVESLLAQDGDAESDVYGTRNLITTLESFELIAPDTSITSGPTGPITDTTPAFAFASTETGAQFQCRFDGAAFGACGAAAALADGSHTFQVRSIDRPGNVDASPASRSFVVDTKGPAMTVSNKARRTNKRGRFTVAVVCPAGETGGCTGKLTLKSAKRVNVNKGRKGKKPRRRVVTFASKSFSLKPGQRANITLALSRKNRSLLKRLKSVRLTASAAAKDGLGNARTSSAKLTLKPPKAKRRKR